MYFLRLITVNFLISVFFVYLFSLPFVAEASLLVSPPVIDGEGVPRDSISGVITLTNAADNRRMRVFTFVNNVSVEKEGGREEFVVLRGQDVADSVANWVSITRQEIMLAPGESKEIPFSASIHRDAKPGKYHAFISFAEGSRRSEAEGKISRDRATLLSIEVKDDSEDILNLRSFITEKSIITGSPFSFIIILDNRGDTVLIPVGEIVVYNKRGKEIGAVEFNKEKISIEPGEESEFKVLWENDLDWGRHRARLALSYGSGGRKYSLNDATFFPNIPIIPLMVLFFVLLSLVILLIHFFHKKRERAHLFVEKRRRNSFGHDEPDEHTINLRDR